MTSHGKNMDAILNDLVPTNQQKDDKKSHKVKVAGETSAAVGRQSTSKEARKSGSSGSLEGKDDHRKTASKNLKCALEDFRTDWKDELQKPQKIKVHTHSPRKEEFSNEPRSSKDNPAISKNFTFQAEESKERKNEMRAFIITEELLKKGTRPKSLQEIDAIARGKQSTSSSTSRQEYFSQKKRIRLSSDDAPLPAKSESILDVFLSDLAEVDDIPFFDCDLPRELAMKIFQHLDACALCRCCQVSKAWKSLAEDDFLWSEICHRFGWEQNANTVDHQEWKQVVEQHVSKERSTQHNWKMRYGAFEQLEYVQGGVITSADSLQTSVVAGYSNGEVHLWDIEVGEECTFAPSSQALVLMDSDGSIPNYVSSIAVSPHFTAGLYSSGNLDIWKNDGETSAHHSVPNTAHLCENKRVTASKNSDSFVYCYSNVVKMIDLNAAEISTRELTFEGQVKNFRIVPSDLNLLAVGSSDSVAIHNWREGSYRVLHNSMMQKISTFDVNHRSLALGIDTLFGSPKIRMYDIASGREEADFRGLTSSVDVINLESSPAQSFVLGSNCRAHVYDTRSPDPVVVLNSVDSRVCCVQMDEWKVVVGSNNGVVSVWDLRTNSRLWEAHNRHAVKYLHFWNQYLLTANLRPHQDLINLENAFEGVAHRRERGCLNIYDFGQKVLREGLPDICHSEFDEPEAFSYNIRLTMPYDNI